MQIKQSTTAYPLVFFMTDSTDHVTGKTGLTCTVTLSKAGGTFASPSGAVTEIASGWYKVAGNATDTATLGPLILHATGTGADATDMLHEVVAFDLQDAVRMGLTALPNAAANAAGGLLTRGTGAGQINQDANGRIDVNVVAETGLTIQTGTAQLGSSTTMRLQSGQAFNVGDLFETTGGATAAGSSGQVESGTGSGSSTPDIVIKGGWSGVAPTVGTTYRRTTKLGGQVAANTSDLTAAINSAKPETTVGAYASGKSPLQPSVAGRTVDVSATGEVDANLVQILGTTQQGTGVAGDNYRPTGSSPT